jgi:hypothetical protein
MKVVMTLLVRDEEDVVDSQIAFHLNGGVDFIVATDNRSEDRTRDILDSYRRDGHLHLIAEESNDFLQQGEWVTRMARMAAAEFGADWIINADADEFWWPRGGSLKDVFAAVRPQFGTLYAMVRHFVPRPDGDPFFAERMTVRVSNPGVGKNNPFGARSLLAHRADPTVAITDGRRPLGAHLRSLSGWYPIDVLHFPIRSWQQCEHKYRLWWEPIVSSGASPPAVYGVAYEAHRRGKSREFYESFVVDDPALERGLSEGTLAIDTRLRDALRAMSVGDSSTIRFDDAVVDAAYLSELGRLAEAEASAVTQRRVDDLEARLATLERSLPARVRRGLLSWPRRPTSAPRASDR